MVENKLCSVNGVLSLFLIHINGKNHLNQKHYQMTHSHSTFIHLQCEPVNLVLIETKIPSQTGSTHYQIEYRFYDRKLKRLRTRGLCQVRGSIYCLSPSCKEA